MGESNREQRKKGKRIKRKNGGFAADTHKTAEIVAAVENGD